MRAGGFFVSRKKLKPGKQSGRQGRLYSEGPKKGKGAVKRVEREQVAAAVEKYAATVYRVALSCVKNRESAEDIMQDVFLKLLRRKDAFESAEHMKRWLIRCTVNAGRDLLASAWRRKATPLDALYDIGEEPDWEERALFDMVMRLPKQCRVICYMHYYEGYSTEEIARIAGCKPSTVRTRLHRARERLRTTLLDEQLEQAGSTVSRKEPDHGRTA